MGKYFKKNKKHKKKEKKVISSEEEEQEEDQKEPKEKYIKKKPKDKDHLEPTKKHVKIKPVTRIGKKTEIGKLLDKYSFLRTDTFSLKNLTDPNIEFDKKTALLLDILNDKEQKTKMIMWEYFCIWRGYVLDKYKKLAEILKLLKQGSMKNLDKELLEKFAKMKNPRYYIMALKKLFDNLFYNIDGLKDAFSRWKKLISDENIEYFKTKLLYTIYRKHKEDKLRNILSKYKDQSPSDIIKENKGKYPEDIKFILEHYFKIWKSILPEDIKEILKGEKIVKYISELRKFKKDKYRTKIEEFERRVKEEEEALRRQYELKDSDLIIMDPKGRIVDIREWRNDPLKRVVTIRYRQEKYYKMKYFLKWYSQAKVQMVIDKLAPIIEGKEKLLNILRQKPALLLLKLLRLNCPEIYIPKLEKLFKLLVKAEPLIFDPYKTFLKKIILYNRINCLNNVLEKIDGITNEYYLRLYLNKWKNNVNAIKEEKRQLLLSFIKKKINDEREISNNRKKELLRRILDRDNKRILNKFRQALKLWALISKVPFLIENGNITTIDGKVVTPENVQDLTENKILSDILGKDIMSKLEDHIIATPEQKDIWKKEKLIKFINRIEFREKAMIKSKLYQWQNNAKYNKIIEGVKAIQRLLKRKLGHKLQKKRKELVDKFIKKLVHHRINQVSKINILKNILKKISASKAFNKLKNENKLSNETEVLKPLVEKAEERSNKLKLKSYFDRWNNISKGIYDKEEDAITKLQSALRGYITKEKINKLLKRNNLLKKFVAKKEQRCPIKYALYKWLKNAMKSLCDESVIPIQRCFRQYISVKKMEKLRDNFEIYKKLCETLANLSGQPSEFFEKMKKIRRTSILGDLAQKLAEKRKNNLQFAIEQLKENYKLDKLEEVVTKADDRKNNKLKYYFQKWHNNANRRNKIEEKLGNLFDKREEKEKMILNATIRKWLYITKMIQYDINKHRIGFFCKKILFKLNKDKSAQNAWKKLTDKLLNDDTKLDINDIVSNIKLYKGMEKLSQNLVKKTRKNAIKQLINEYKRDKWNELMKDLIENIDKNNTHDILHNYLKKWKKANRGMKKKEKVLDDSMKILSAKILNKSAQTLGDAFINKKLFDTVDNIKKLIVLRRLSSIAKNDKQNNDIKNDLIKAYEATSKDAKNKFITKIYKLYTNKVLENLINKLSKIQKEKSIEPKGEFLNKLNIIAINDKEYGYKNINKIDVSPKITNIHFSTKAKEIEEPKPKEIKSNSNLIPIKVILPELLDYLNDLIIKRKRDAFNGIMLKDRNEMLKRHIKSYINKMYLPEMEKLFEYLKYKLTEGPLQIKLMKLLRKIAIKKLFDPDDMYKISRLFNLNKLFKITIVNSEIAHERWIRTLIRKWRFQVFTRTMTKKKLSFLYKNFHANYLEMANNIFGEQDLNPSVTKEFERFASDVGFWENEKPDYADKIKHSKTLNKRIGIRSPISKFKENVSDFISDDENIKLKKVKEDEKEDKKVEKKEEKKKKGKIEDDEEDEEGEEIEEEEEEKENGK